MSGPAGPTTQSAGGGSPEAAFLLGLIPGVGAIYNAEYIKAAIHLLVFGTIVSIADASHGTADALWGLLAFGFYMYMPFEAYYTAKKRKLAREGINLITPFDTFDLISLERLARLWPALLILAGLAIIRRFLKGNKA